LGKEEEGLKTRYLVAKTAKGLSAANWVQEPPAAGVTGVGDVETRRGLLS